MSEFIYPSNLSIKSITIPISNLGIRSYCIGDKVNGKVVSTIIMKPLLFTGNPFDHYVGMDGNGQILFTVNCEIPCNIEYLTK